MHFGCISGRAFEIVGPLLTGAIAALVYIDENRLLKRLDSGDWGIRFKAAYRVKGKLWGKPELP